jgi:hypothetical protein
VIFFTIDIDNVDPRKHKLAVPTAVDGSEVPALILGKNVDATTQDVESFAFISGEFDEDSLFFGVGFDADSVRDTLEAKNIYLKKRQ